MIQKAFILAIVQFFSFSIFSQKDIPVKWQFEVEEMEVGYKLIMEATIEDGWYVYATATPKGGPIASSFMFDRNETLGLQKEIEENGDLIIEQSDLFEIEVHKYKKHVQFIKYFTPRDKVQYISGSVNYMSCNGWKCLPPTDINFKVSLNK